MTLSSTSTLLIRQANTDEVVRLAAIGYAAWEAGILPVVKAEAGLKERERMRIRAFAERGLHAISVAEFGRQPVGWIARATGSSYVSFLFVLPGFQGQGVGSALLNRVESMMELEGLDVAVLDTPEDHVRAVQFYLQHGYHILPHAPDRRHGSGLAGVRLEKYLNPIYGSLNDVE